MTGTEKKTQTSQMCCVHISSVCVCPQPAAAAWFRALSAADQQKIHQGTDLPLVSQFLQQVNTDWQKLFSSVKPLIDMTNRTEVAAKVMDCVNQARVHQQPQSRLFAGTRGIGKVC
jgi:hypothetical protein